MRLKMWSGAEGEDQQRRAKTKLSGIKVAIMKILTRESVNVCDKSVKAIEELCTLRSLE